MKLAKAACRTPLEIVVDTDEKAFSRTVAVGRQILPICSVDSYPMKLLVVGVELYDPSCLTVTS